MASHREKAVEVALADGNVAEGAGEEYAEMLVRRVLKAADPHLRRAHFEERDKQWREALREELEKIRYCNKCGYFGPKMQHREHHDCPYLASADLQLLDKAQELLEGERGKS